MVMGLISIRLVMCGERVVLDRMWVVRMEL